jgi:uncharacterized protein YcbX
MIPKIEHPKIKEDEYWESVAKGRKVVPLIKPCGDCAVTTGFYSEFAEKLKFQPKETQEKVMDTWFCHNACNRGCAGIREFIKK